MLLVLLGEARNIISSLSADPFPTPFPLSVAPNLERESPAQRRTPSIEIAFIISVRKLLDLGLSAVGFGEGGDQLLAGWCVVVRVKVTVLDRLGCPLRDLRIGSAQVIC